MDKLPINWCRISSINSMTYSLGRWFTVEVDFPTAEAGFRHVFNIPGGPLLLVKYVKWGLNKPL